MTERPERRLDFGRPPAKTVVEHKAKPSQIGWCEALRGDSGVRCGNKAYWRDEHGRVLCGLHYRPAMRKKEADRLDADTRAYLQRHVDVYANDMMNRANYPDGEIGRIVEQHDLGTIPEGTPLLAKLRLQARGIAARREKERRGL